MDAGAGSSTNGLRASRRARVAWGLAFGLVLGWMAWAAHAAFWHCDDAYISFRYVWHALHGDGLVFNAGERVEGYTNLAWVLELLFVQRVGGPPPEIACDLLSVLCSAGCVACIVLLARASPFAGRRAIAALGALALLAASHTWAVWTTSGLETRQFTLCVLAGALFLQRAVREPDSPHFRRRLVLAALAFALSELTRPEGGLLGACAGAWLVLETWIARRRSLLEIAWFATPLVLILVAHFVWRHAYYGEWLPNTYYAKVVRAWPEAGWRYAVSALIETGSWLLVPFALVAAAMRARRGDRFHVLAGFLIVPHAAYLVMIGGDHFEWRPLDFDWPFLALAASEGLVLVAARILALRPRVGARPTLVPERALGSALLAIACVYVAAVQVAKLRYTMQFTTRSQTLRLGVDLTRASSPWLYRLPGMRLWMPLYLDAYAFDLSHGVGVVWREHERFWRDEMNAWGALTCLRDEGALPADMVVSRISIGVVGYCLARTTLIDQKGLTDRHVARTPSKRSNAVRYMAHDREADEAYLEQRGVNVHLVGSAGDAATALRDAAYALRACDGTWMSFDARDRAWVARAFRPGTLWSWKLASALGTFDSGDEGWMLSGTFARGPRTGLQPARAKLWPPFGSGLHNLDSRAGDGSALGIGDARSPPFQARAGTRLSVRLAGDARGGGAGARLECDGASVHEFGAPAQAFLPQVVDLTPWAGRACVLHVHDDSDAAWIAAGDVVVLAPGPLETP